MDAEMQQQLLQDPAVQAAVQQAGQDALKDPAVQDMIVKTAQEKFPQYAASAKEKAMEWSKDPAVQAKAYEYAGIAGQYLGQAGETTVGLVEQGPTGVRMLAFAAGVMSCINAGMYCINVGNLLNIVIFVVSGYQIVFSLTTIIFEAPPSVIAKIPGITQYQDILIDKAKFMSEVAGRGLFYIFQGLLWLAFANVTNLLNLAVASLCHPLTLVVGFFMVFVGVLHIAMYFGQLGTMATKLREGQQQLAQRVG